VTGESGLPAMVLFSSLLFAVMFAFQPALSPRIRQYATWFLIGVFAVECVLVLHQTIEIRNLHTLVRVAHKAGSVEYNPIFTTEHTVVVEVINKQSIHATVRDPRFSPYGSS
jgi:hypothetical protein